VRGPTSRNRCPCLADAQKKSGTRKRRF
jgi:hypothetical protein